jgi:hypothetical protein
MLKPITAALLAIAPVLTGCHTAIPTMSAPAAAVSATAKVAPALTGTQVRRLLAVEGGAALWGINYSQHQSRSWGKSYNKTTDTGNAAFTGKGTLVRAAFNRYVYQVPDGQVLIHNKVEGGNGANYSGAIAVNGFGVGVTNTAELNYVYGPGELVVFTFNPAQSYAYNGSGSGYTNYYGVSISGYTASPDMLASLGGVRGSK